MKNGRARLALWLVSAMVGLAGCASAPGAPSDAGGLDRIKHVVVIYAENHSFDNLYGLFPGANGIGNATVEQKRQLDHDGTPLPSLTVWGADGKADPRFPRLPNGPFRIDAPPIDMGLDRIVPSPIHAFYHNQEQINRGQNNMFAAMSQVGGWVMGHYDGSQMKLWQWAREYTLADNFFMGAFGGSYLNHQWLVCACTPVFPNAPGTMRARLDSKGKLEQQPGSPSARDGAVRVASGGGGGQVAPDGYSVNTAQPPFQPSGVPPAPQGSLDLADPAGTPQMGAPLPPQSALTIGDVLSA